MEKHVLSTRASYTGDQAKPRQNDEGARWLSWSLEPLSDLQSAMEVSMGINVWQHMEWHQLRENIAAVPGSLMDRQTDMMWYERICSRCRA